MNRKERNMGIAVSELLANDFFRDFEVVAGRKGINKEIQGITTLQYDQEADRPRQRDDRYRLERSG